MYVFSSCRNELLLIINVYVENNPTVRGLNNVVLAFLLNDKALEQYLVVYIWNMFDL